MQSSRRRGVRRRNISRRTINEVLTDVLTLVRRMIGLHGLDGGVRVEVIGIVVGLRFQRVALVPACTRHPAYRGERVSTLGNGLVGCRSIGGSERGGGFVEMRFKPGA